MSSTNMRLFQQADFPGAGGGVDSETARTNLQTEVVDLKSNYEKIEQGLIANKWGQAAEGNIGSNEGLPKKIEKLDQAKNLLGSIQSAINNAPQTTQEKVQTEQKQDQLAPGLRLGG